ncbi:MAG: hypothetical protein ABFD82_16875 [Syntrophaceae bacterium]
MEPSKEHSSKQKCFGVSGWPLGKDCPDMELYWGEVNWDSKEDPNSSVFFRNASGAIFKLPEGIAMFSPNCKLFWHSDYYKHRAFRVFSTKTGRSILKITGEYPAWSLDGASIYYFRTAKSRRQLWELNIKDKKNSLILEVQDYLPCFQQAEEVERYPVIVTKEGYVLWSYWVKGPDGDYTSSAKKLIIEPKRKRIIKTEHKDFCPCSAFEEEN